MLKEQLQNPQFREFVDVDNLFVPRLIIETKVSRRSPNRPPRTLNRSRPTNSKILPFPSRSPTCIPLQRTHFRTQHHQRNRSNGKTSRR